MQDGSFIVIEGGEGAGKSTVVQALRKRYADRDVVWTREPGGSEFGKIIREMILSTEGGAAHAHTLFELFWADRTDHMHTVVVPALQAGTHVLSDRFDASTFAYQIYGDEHHELTELFYEKRELYLGAHTPDLYVFLDVDPTTALERVTTRGEAVTHFEERKLAFHARVREGFQIFLADKPHVVIDAGLPVEDVAEAVVKEVATHFH